MLIFPEAVTGRTGVMLRTLTKEECPWLDKTLPESMAVFEFVGDTFGVITEAGIAVSLEPNSYPFYQVPFSAVGWE